MFELLLTSSGGGGIYVPESGPGTKYITKGDRQLGYFGALTSADLFTGSELSNLTGMNGAGAILNDNVIWHKFAYNGRVLFIPQKPLRFMATWGQLYTNGLIYGTDDVGRYPYPSTSVNQIRLVSKNDNRFKVRLITGAQSFSSPIVAGGEWNDLIYRLSAADPNQSYWAKLSDADLGWVANNNGFESLIAERMPGDTGNTYARFGTSAVMYSYPVGGSSVYVGWRPVLDLVLSSDPVFMAIDGGYNVVTDVPIDVSGMVITYPSNIDGTALPDAVYYTTDSMYDVSSVTTSIDPSAPVDVYYTNDPMYDISSLVVTIV